MAEIGAIVLRTEPELILKSNWGIAEEVAAEWICF